MGGKTCILSCSNVAKRVESFCCPRFTVALEGRNWTRFIAQRPCVNDGVTLNLNFLKAALHGYIILVY